VDTYCVKEAIQNASTNFMFYKPNNPHRVTNGRHFTSDEIKARAMKHAQSCEAGRRQNYFSNQKLSGGQQISNLESEIP
jgi:hypothetical protein